MSDPTSVSFEECVLNAKRLLEFAEDETDLAKMERRSCDQDTASCPVGIHGTVPV